MRKSPVRIIITQKPRSRLICLYIKQIATKDVRPFLRSRCSGRLYSHGQQLATAGVIPFWALVYMSNSVYIRCMTSYLSLSLSLLICKWHNRRLLLNKPRLLYRTLNLIIVWKLIPLYIRVLLFFSQSGNEAAALRQRNTVGVDWEYIFLSILEAFDCIKKYTHIIFSWLAILLAAWPTDATQYLHSLVN